MSNTSTIKLLNTNKKLPVTVYAFDNDSVTLPANQMEPLPVDSKFAWNLPRGVKNLTPVAKPVEEETNPTVVESEMQTPSNTPPQIPISPLKNS